MNYAHPDRLKKVNTLLVMGNTKFQPDRDESSLYPFYRAKTIHTAKVKKEIAAIITPETHSIIGRCGNPDKQSESYIFGFLKGDETPMQIKTRVRDVISNCNKHLKK